MLTLNVLAVNQSEIVVEILAECKMTMDPTVAVSNFNNTVILAKSCLSRQRVPTYN